MPTSDFVINITFYMTIYYYVYNLAKIKIQLYAMNRKTPVCILIMHNFTYRFHILSSYPPADGNIFANYSNRRLHNSIATKTQSFRM